MNLPPFEGYPGVSLGPEDDMPSRPPEPERDMVIQAANRFMKHSRYPAHNERMLDLLERYDLSTPGLEMAVALHDVVDHGLIDPDSEERTFEAGNLTGHLYEEVDDKSQFTYALGCAISTGYWESEIGEGWRFTGAQAFEHKTPEERRQIIAAIRGDKAVEIDEAVLKEAKPDDIEIDTSALRNAMQQRDVEGLIIKSVELLDNLDNPPPNNPASTWRDCVETIKSYAPALELFGFSELANDLRGKALEYFYDEDEETVEKARRQHELSVRHFDFINDAMESVIAEALRDIEGFEGLERSSTLISRIKSEGSIREKLHKKDYIDAEFVPDGVGYRLILSDDVGQQEIIEIGEKIKALFTDQYSEEVPEAGFLARHPVAENPVDESISKPRDESGYSAYHLALQQIIFEDGEHTVVPVEIQIVTETQERLHTYDKASHVLYKGGTAARPEVIDDLRQIEMRAEHLRDKPLNQELNAHTWFDIVSLLPELNTPMHHIYKPVGTETARALVPHELENFIGDELSASEMTGDIMLPPAHMNIDDFNELISLIDPNLKDDQQIQNALKLLAEQELPDRTGGLDTLEGHLLPVAFHAGIMASLSSRHWDERDSSKFLSDTITAALLHDTVEDIGKGKRKKTKARMQARMRDRIRNEFGFEVANTVDALTSPGEENIEDSHERRTVYANQVADNPSALMIKLSDRMQNHTVDLVRLAVSDPGPKAVGKIKAYFAKTLTYKSPLFDEKLPEEYRLTHKTVMGLAEKLFPDIFEL